MLALLLATCTAAYELPPLDPDMDRKDGTGEIVRLRYPSARRYNFRIEQGGAGLLVQGRFIQPLNGGKASGPRTWLGSFRPGQRYLDVVLIPTKATTVASFVDGDSGEALAVATYATRTGALRHTGTLYRRKATQFPRDFLGRGPLLTAVVTRTDALPVGTVALEATATGTVVRTDPLGVELLAFGGKGHRPRQVTAEMPWRYADPGYLAAESKPPKRDLAAHYKNPRHVQTILEGLAAAHPDRVRLEQLGESREGRPILALGLGNLSAKKKLMFNGAHHGDEILTVDVVLDIAQELLAADDALTRRVMSECAVWLVPMVNPDGNHAFLNNSTRAGRKNGRDTNNDGQRGISEGVDLNRNYPTDWAELCDKVCSRRNPTSRNYRGDLPASEPETRAMMRLAEREKFVASISYHMGMVAVLLPHPRDGSHGELGALGETVAQALSKHPSGIPYAARESSRTVRGADQDYHWHEHGTLALLVEMHGWPPPATPAGRKEVLVSVRPAWRTVAEWVLR